VVGHCKSVDFKIKDRHFASWMHDCQSKKVRQNAIL